MTDEPALPPTEDDSDQARVRRIYARYSGKFEQLDFNQRDTRAQLALDVGFLVGMCERLLRTTT